MINLGRLKKNLSNGESLLVCRTLKFLITLIFILSLYWSTDKKIYSKRQHQPEK